MTEWVGGARLRVENKVAVSPSSGRDKICIVWDLRSHQALRTVPVFESVEAAVLLPEEPAPQLGVKSTDLHFLTAGNQGVLRVWEAASGQCVHTQQQLSGPGRELTHCTLVRAAGLLLSVTADHNLLLYEARSLQLQKQFAGYSEEILDVRFLGPEDSHIVVASNSPCLKVFELHTSACQILHGHTGEGTQPMPLDSLPGLNCFSFPLIGLSPLHPRHCVGPRCVPEGAAICQLCQGPEYPCLEDEQGW